MRLSLSGPVGSFKGVIRVPGDKSISHRALLLAALAHGPSRIKGMLRAGVTEVMLQNLRLLGADAEFLREDDLVILGGSWRAPGVELNCGRSATTMRMLLGALAPKPIEARLSGTAQLRQRPMARVVRPLVRMGAHIEGTNGDDQPPLLIRGGHLQGIELRQPMASAQVKTAVLLAGLFAEGETIIHEAGPSRDHTERMLRALGVPLLIENGSVRVSQFEDPLPPLQLHVPGDISSAAFPLVAAAAQAGSKLWVRGIGVNPRRTGLVKALRAMGAAVRVEDLRLEQGEPVADIQVVGAELRGIEVGGSQIVRMIDEIPILAVAMTQAQGESVVRDAQELRLKESDRIEALAAELCKMGAEIETSPDGFRVWGPTQLRGAHLTCHGDHRLGMALTVAAMLGQGETVIEGIEVVEESFPHFLEMWASLGVTL